MSLERYGRRMYEERYRPHVAFRVEMWKVLCQDFFQRYIPERSTVLEIGGGTCEFINHIRAAQRIVVDANEALPAFCAAGVRPIVTSSTDLSAISDATVDVVFVSNFFEHLTREDIVRTLEEIGRVMKADGRLLVLQPNIRFCARDYWMFFDHITPLDDRSLTEALEMTTFRVTECIVRFLPFAMKGSRLPKSALMVRLYLKFPLAWRVLGQQSFLVAKKRAPG